MLYTYFKTQLFEYKEQKNVIRSFYSDTNFAKLDQELLAQYQSRSAYQVSSSFLLAKGTKDPHIYGETPLTTMDTIVKECGLSRQDTLIELGGGRGRAALFLAAFHHMQVVCYEQIPQFVQNIPSCERLTTLCGDFFDADFSTCTAIYLFGTLLDEEEITKLCAIFPQNVKIITVSYPLSLYDEKYLTKKSFPGIFAWGETEIFWNERISG